MTCVAVVGLQWGDEGKGKIVDCLSQYAAAVVRFQGGHNAGHTIYSDAGQRILHLLPSGALRENIECLIGNGVVVSPRALIAEVQELNDLGIEISSRLRVSEACPLVLECHRLLDRARESRRGKSAIGTTAKGIGPAYEDKIARRAVRFADISDWDSFSEKMVECLNITILY